MALAHVSAGKIAYVTVHVVALSFYALDPSVKVAYIGLAGVGLTNLTALIMLYLKLTRVQQSVDGKLDTLIETKAHLAHAEGRQQGSDEERARDKA